MTNYKHQYEAMKKMVAMYQDELEPELRERIKELETDNCEQHKRIVWLESCRNCAIYRECNRHGSKIVHNCDHWVEAMGAIETVPARRGQWVRHFYDSGEPIDDKWYCSECAMCGDYRRSLYCPECGAKMDV